MEQINNIYPLIVMDYYPLRINMEKDEYSIYMCRNIQDIEKVISAYHKAMGQLIRNVKITKEIREISFETADTYFDTNEVLEESDWYNKSVSFETLKIFENGTDK